MRRTFPWVAGVILLLSCGDDPRSASVLDWCSTRTHGIPVGERVTESQLIGQWLYCPSPSLDGEAPSVCDFRSDGTVVYYEIDESAELQVSSLDYQFVEGVPRTVGFGEGAIISGPLMSVSATKIRHHLERERPSGDPVAMICDFPEME